ncbi:ABC multidrug transporter [Cordyceps javanica]|uniref:ABC multidrug transporter n=1 Tax=Cordyceps javanica TaxID=43265 RepID=A0A545UU97_9HYPO|nr:ABC multidrug transporter [Cordyceps javanica]TQW04930.1 ABC multidrug transporter [Cordyceps javanica]
MSFAESASQSLFQINEKQFDFNLRFEQVFFSIVPSAIFIVASLWRALFQASRPVVVAAPVFQAVKVTIAAVYTAIELALLIVAARGGLLTTQTFVASSSLRLVAALLMVLLSYVDHGKSLRPSALLNIHVLVTLILDVAQARTLLLLASGNPHHSGPELAYSALFVVVVVVKLVILILESRSKAKWAQLNGKERSPEETSGIFSLGVFSWLSGIFLVGYKKVMTADDLFPLDSALDSGRLHAKFVGNLRAAALKDDRFALLKALAWTMRGTILLAIVPRLCLLGFTFSQPFFIESLLDALSLSVVPANISYGLVAAAFFIYAGIAVSTAFYWYYHYRMLAMARAMLVTEIYAHSARLPDGRAGDNAAVTLMSTDWERINDGFKAVHDIWASLAQVGLASWMLHRQLGRIFFAPLGIVLVSFAGVTLVSRFTGASQRVWMKGVEKRVGLTATTVGHMKNLKISGLSSAIEALIQKLRVEELAAGSLFRQLTVVAVAFGFAPMVLSPPLTLAFSQRILDATRTFTSLSYLVLLTLPLGIVFQQIPLLIGAVACIGRIQDFFARETHEDYRMVFVNDQPSSEGESMHDGYAIEIVNGKFGWETDKPVLQDVNVAIPQSSLVIVVGPVASGKSTFCKALLGESAYHEGSVTFRPGSPQIGYCDQTPFLFNGSIRDNILGHSEFDAERYSEVTEATALRFDIDNLPQGDRTNIGSDGITLSGGQRQRVSLARALYLETAILVFDDVFSGLDADTEDVVFRRVFGPAGLLRRRRSTVILCTHSVRHLRAADHIIALGAGTIAEQGSFADLVDDPGSYVNRLRVGSESSSEAGSEETVASGKAEVDVKLPQVDVAITTEADDKMGADLTRQRGDSTMYKHYATSMGIFTSTAGIAFTAAYGVLDSYPNVWLKYWSDDATKGFIHHSFGYYATVYAALMLAAMACLIISIILFLVIGVKRAGANLHQTAITTMIGAPLSFFTATDTGVVTNLFSQDLNLVDTELPMALINCLFAFFQALGQACVMLTASPYIAITYPFLVTVLFLLAKVYLRTSRQMRLLDLEAKSPLYTHFLDTIKGVVSMRAFAVVPENIVRNNHLLNASQRPAYLLAMMQQWLTLVLGIVVAVLAMALTALATRMHSSSGFTGASMVTLMSFGESLTMIVQFYTRLETSMGAVTRLKTFSATVQPENRKHEVLIPAPDWPRKGEIRIESVSASYEVAESKTTDASHLALRNINLNILAGEKVAVCGRTGSGKSSFVALLLKLLDPVPDSVGGVFVDGIALSSIQRCALRQRILSIPQEAVFLPDGSTFQENLDPAERATADDCAAVLRVVDLWDFVQERGGLKSCVSSGTLSAGQRQLLSLGRTVLGRRLRARDQGIDEGSAKSEGGILLLDEVNASVDVETERIMQEVIEREFRKYTVVAVSHRLDMIMDFDKVVVMDKGEIVENGHPATLSRQEGSRFRDLIKASHK